MREKSAIFYNETSVFLPENLLREARRQKQLNECVVPKTCILDPDGDIVRYLKKTNNATLNTCWACYHSDMFSLIYNGEQFGIIGCVVGASYAVLVAEQLFASGCEILISVTSAGKINEDVTSDYLLITNTLRDEGTSRHYLPDNEESVLDAARDQRRSLAEHHHSAGRAGKILQRAQGRFCARRNRDVA